MTCITANAKYLSLSFLVFLKDFVLLSNMKSRTLIKLKLYLQRIYRLSFNKKKYKEIVWNDLNKYFKVSGLRYGVYENEKVIETVFETSNDQALTFYYEIVDSCLVCKVNVLENYQEELTTDFFILATHFNNLLIDGKVVISVTNRYIKYVYRRELLAPLLFHKEIHIQVTRHYSTSFDIYEAFQRLLTEQESPAIIIADLLKKQEREGDKEQ